MMIVIVINEQQLPIFYTRRDSLRTKSFQY
jgi:hypothetical protein